MLLHLVFCLLLSHSPCSTADVATDPLAAVAALAKVLVWRTAEVCEDYPLAAEYRFWGHEKVEGDAPHREWTKGVGYTRTGGKPIRIVLVANEHLEVYLNRQSLTNLEPLNPNFQQNLCRDGRFLLNDPRVGLFHNQRISYEVALQVASVLRRTLVLPGFFKFPHPDAYEGTQWVQVRSLFDFSALQNCYRDVIQLDDLLEQCGPEVLTNHVTVPFLPSWMYSSVKAPWINATRPQLRWAPYDGGPIVHLRSKRTRAGKPLQLDEPFWYLLHSFLEAGVADARTVRVHGLIAADASVRGVSSERPVCFLPNRDVFQTAREYANRMGFVGGSTLLGIHLRLFKRSMTTTGGYMRPEAASEQERLCNLEPEVFIPLVAWSFRWMFNNFWPTHTYLATNEADPEALFPYLHGFPGPRHNPYRPDQFNQAVTGDESVEALASVLIDAIIVSMADYFIGNACSTMSQYIGQLRRYAKLPKNSSMFLGGESHADMIQQYRSMVENKEVYFMRAE